MTHRRKPEKGVFKDARAAKNLEQPADGRIHLRQRAEVVSCGQPIGAIVGMVVFRERGVRQVVRVQLERREEGRSRRERVVEERLEARELEERIVAGDLGRYVAHA